MPVTAEEFPCDRLLVTRTVKSRFSTGRRTTFREQDELVSFNQNVRRLFAPVVARIGTTPQLPYKYIVMICQCQLWAILDRAVRFGGDANNDAQTLKLIWYHFVFMFGLWPLMSYIAFWAAACSNKLPDVKAGSCVDILVSILTSWFLFCICVALWFPICSSQPLLLSIVAGISYLLVLPLCYSEQRPWCKHKGPPEVPARTLGARLDTASQLIDTKQNPSGSMSVVCITYWSCIAFWIYWRQIVECQRGAWQCEVQDHIGDSMHCRQFVSSAHRTCTVERCATDMLANDIMI